MKEPLAWQDGIGLKLLAPPVNNRKDLAGPKAQLTLVECFAVERRHSIMVAADSAVVLLELYDQWD